jgi:hypothetical protein
MGGLRGLASTVVAVLLVVLVVILAVLASLSRRPAPAASGGGRAQARGPPDEKVVDWDGPAPCLPARAVAEALRGVRAAIRGFGPATPAERAELDALAARLSKKHGVSLSGAQLAAVRDMEVSTAARHSGLRAQRYGAEIAKAFAAGDGVLAISARLRIAPLAVLRQVLVEGGTPEAQVRDLVANPARLPPRLAAEAPAVFEADIGSRLNADRTKAQSQAYEDAVGAHLRRLGVEFQTEGDLRDAHERAVARGESPPPLLTPDFLLPRPVRIRVDGTVSRPIAWLDAKNYPAVDSKLVMGGLARQAAKYTTRFGPGAFVFSGGVMCGSKTGQLGVLVLDGSHLAP